MPGVKPPTGTESEEIKRPTGDAIIGAPASGAGAGGGITNLIGSVLYGRSGRKSNRGPERSVRKFRQDEPDIAAPLRNVADSGIHARKGRDP